MLSSLLPKGDLDTFHHKTHLKQNLPAFSPILCLKVNPLGYRSYLQTLTYSHILASPLIPGMWQEPAGCVVEWGVCRASVML